jgi:hypothetical protein
LRNVHTWLKSLILATPRHEITHAIASKQAGAALAYLGIVATFAAFSLIGCGIWLLIS